MRIGITGSIAVALLLILLVASTPSALARKKPPAERAAPQVAFEYDKFKDRTMITTDRVGWCYPPSLWCTAWPQHLTVEAYFYSKGQLEAPPDTINILFVSKTEGWRYLRSHDLAILADGERIIPEDTSRDSATLGGSSVAEYLYAYLPPAVFKKIAEASVVEAKLGMDEFTLTKAQQRAFLAVYEKYQGILERHPEQDEMPDIRPSL